MSNPEPSTQSNFTVANDGDIILVLPQNIHIRVSSIILSYTSPVFKAMLGPEFMEGHTPRSAAQPHKIALLDNDSAAMKHLCHLLHRQTTNSNDDHPSEAFAERLQELAILADKYNCVTAIMLQVEAVLSRFLNRGAAGKLSVVAMLFCTGAAYMMRLPRHFYAFSKRMVLDHCTSFSELLDDEGCSVALPAEVLRKQPHRLPTTR